MKVIVLGAGHIGYEIAKQLSFEEHDVSVIDNNAYTIKQISDKLDVKPLLGNAVDINILKEAGLADANVLIATTSSDETNIVACQIADFMFGVESKIARVNAKSYFTHANMFGKNKLSVDFLTSPDIEISYLIKRSIYVYGALDFISCMGDKIKIVGMQCTKKSVVINTPLKFLSNVLNNIQIVILFIERNNISFIPNKKDVIIENDNIYFAVQTKDVATILSLFSDNDKDQNNIVLIGGGNISQEIAKSIIHDNFDINVKIIENDITIAENLSQNLENVEIIYGNPLDQDILKQSLISKAETVIAITTDDKINILTCLLAKTFGAKRVSAMVKETSNTSLFHALGVNTILDPKQAVIAKILEYVRKGGNETISTLSGSNTEMFIINVNNKSRAIGILIDDISSSGKIKIVALVRENNTYLLPKRMIVNSEDKLLFVCDKNALSKVVNLFKDKPKYLL